MAGKSATTPSTSGGINSRLDEIQAALLRAKLRHLADWNSARRRIAQRYNQLLAGTGLLLPDLPADESHVWHLYVVQTDQRDRLQAALLGARRRDRHSLPAAGAPPAGLPGAGRTRQPAGHRAAGQHCAVAADLPRADRRRGRCSRGGGARGIGMSKAAGANAGGRRTKDERPIRTTLRPSSFVLRPSSLCWRSDALLALAAGLLAVLLLALAYTRAWPLAVDVGTRDARFVAGFNATEDFGGRLVRWTGGDATVALPRPPDRRPALLSVTLLNSRPDGNPNPHVTLSADGRTLAVFDVARTRGGSGVQTYHVPLPGGVQLDWATRIRLQSDTITLPKRSAPAWRGGRSGGADSSRSGSVAAIAVAAVLGHAAGRAVLRLCA